MSTTPAASIVSSAPNAFGAILGAADANGDGIADAFVSLLGSCDTGSDPPGDVLVYDFSSPSAFRAFVAGPKRAVPIGKDEAPLCVRLESRNGAVALEDVEVSSIQLVTDTGAIETSPPNPNKTVVVSDTDGNGLSELPSWFSAASLRTLFGTVRGKTTVQARLEGEMSSGRKFAAPLTLTVIGTPASSVATSARVSPNPMNPAGILSFATAVPGNASIGIYDVSGRLVRALPQQHFSAGQHSVLFDGRSTAGAELGSGVYFYRIETSTEHVTGRFVIAR